MNKKVEKYRIFLRQRCHIEHNLTISQKTKINLGIKCANCAKTYSIFAAADLKLQQRLHHNLVTKQHQHSYITEFESRWFPNILSDMHPYDY